jgi:hypothetical protein
LTGDKMPVIIRYDQEVMYVYRPDEMTPVEERAARLAGLYQRVEVHINPNLDDRVKSQVRTDVFQMIDALSVLMNQGRSQVQPIREETES